MASRPIQRSGGAIVRGPTSGNSGCCCEPPMCPDLCGAIDGDSLLVDWNVDDLEFCDGFSTIAGTITGTLTDIPLPPAETGWANTSTGLTATTDIIAEAINIIMTCSVTAYPECALTLHLYFIGADTGDIYYHTDFSGDLTLDTPVADMNTFCTTGVRAFGGSVTIHISE